MRFKVLGINDEQDSCQCCSKTGLKRVVWIEDTETGDIQHFGTSCAQSPNKAFGLKSEISKAIREFEAEKKRKAIQDYSEAVTKAVSVAVETYNGAMLTRTVHGGPLAGRVQVVPVNSDDFQRHKMETIERICGKRPA